MKSAEVASDGLSPGRRRRLVQVIFVFVNLALVEVHLPGPLWLAIGATFWAALIGVTISGSNLVCGTMCWIGAIQDIFEPFARPRLVLDARMARSVTLAILVLWMPIGWFVLPDLAAHDRMPINFSLSWERHLFQAILAIFVAASVAFLGKRGLCRYLCPFNTIVAAVRARLPRLPRRTPSVVASSTGSIPCTGGCVGCARREEPAAIPAYERLSTR